MLRLAPCNPLGRYAQNDKIRRHCAIKTLFLIIKSKACALCGKLFAKQSFENSAMLAGFVCKDKSVDFHNGKQGVKIAFLKIKLNF